MMSEETDDTEADDGSRGYDYIQNHTPANWTELTRRRNAGVDSHVFWEHDSGDAMVGVIADTEVTGRKDVSTPRFIAVIQRDGEKERVEPRNGGGFLCAVDEAGYLMAGVDGITADEVAEQTGVSGLTASAIAKRFRTLDDIRDAIQNRGMDLTRFEGVGPTGYEQLQDALGGGGDE